MVPESRQALVVRVEANLARAARAFLTDAPHAYAGLDELIEVALVNQLNIEGFPLRSSALADDHNSAAAFPHVDPAVDKTVVHKRQRGPGDVPTTSSIIGDPTAALVEPQTPGDESLFVMTNRLSPIKVAARSLAVSSRETGNWPTIGDFHAQASAFARAVGLRLRAEGSRRWVGYPVAPDIAKAKERFVNSFTIIAAGGRARGPMSLLGLAAIIEESRPTKRSRGEKSTARPVLRVALTNAGWKLATLPCPLLGECDGETLSSAEATLLIDQILRAPRERDAIRGFLGLVRRSAGIQSRLDELMATRDSQKSADLVVAERAALVGRLTDLGLVLHEGRGAGGRVSLTSSGRELLDHLQREEKSA
jgi:hypothetical protein